MAPEAPPTPQAKEHYPVVPTAVVVLVSEHLCVNQGEVYTEITNLSVLMMEWYRRIAWQVSLPPPLLILTRYTPCTVAETFLQKPIHSYI